MSTLKVTFTNSSGFGTSDIYIGFLQGPPTPGLPAIGFDITKVSDGSTIAELGSGTGDYPQAGVWYTYEELKDGVSIKDFSGRVYICYGTPWSIVASGYEPAQAVTDPNFFLRYDKFEMTFQGAPADVANLTSIDYWSIPLTLKGSMGSTPGSTVNGMLTGVTANTMYSDLSAITTPPKSGLPPLKGVDGELMPAVVPGSFLQYPSGDPAPTTDFCRIIGPSSYPPPGGRPVAAYDTLMGYLGNLITQFGPGTTKGAVIPTLGDGVIATIAGSFAGLGPGSKGSQAAQTYNLSATIDADSNITLTGTGSVVGAITMVFSKTHLMDPAGMYGGNTKYSLNGADPVAPGNDVYGWICGDIFAGLNVGAVGSIVEINGTKAGALQSSDWFADITVANMFSGLQSNSNYYNNYAATLAGISEAYNFAYTDRFARVFLSLNPATMDTMEVVLENASVTT